MGRRLRVRGTAALMAIAFVAIIVLLGAQAVVVGRRGRVPETANVPVIVVPA